MLSVIIPTRESAQSLRRLLGDITPHDGQLIISDSGFASDVTDETLDAALSAGANIALGRSGRGWQLARGARLAMMIARSKNCGAQQHWMLFLHADSQLPQEWRGDVQAHMTDHPEMAAYFRLKFDDDGLWPRLFECCVALRCSLFGLPYGDQGLLIRQDIYENAGGYPDWELFEDVALVRALGGKNLRALLSPLVTDASKYKKEGYMRRAFRNIVLLMKFLRGGAPERLSANYKQRDI